jgi:hypothetical protein
MSASAQGNLSHEGAAREMSGSTVVAVEVRPVLFLALSLAACVAGEAPGWTLSFAPPFGLS